MNARETSLVFQVQQKTCTHASFLSLGEKLLRWICRKEIILRFRSSGSDLTTASPRDLVSKGNSSFRVLTARMARPTDSSLATCASRSARNSAGTVQLFGSGMLTLLIRPCIPSQHGRGKENRERISEFSEHSDDFIPDATRETTLQNILAHDESNDQALHRPQDWH